MAVIKCFFTIVLRHLGIISIYLTVFISLCAGFSAQSKEFRESVFALKEINFAVSDSDNSELSEALIKSLSKDNNLVEYKNPTLETVKDALYSQEIEYAVFIPEGFEKSFLGGKPEELKTAQASGSMASAYLDNSLNRFLNIYGAYLTAGIGSGEAAESALKYSAEKGEVNLSEGVTGDSPPAVYYYFDFLAYALMTMMMMGLAPILQLFLAPGSKERLDVSPMGRGKINFSLALSSAVFACVCFLALWIYGIVCYGDQMFTQAAKICTLSAVCFMPCCLGLAYLIAHTAKNPATVNAAGNAVSLALCFLGGVYVPLEVMSDEILNVARFTPTYRYISVAETAYKYAELTNAQMSEIYSYIGIELLFGAAFFAAALALSVRKREG